jgi:hypothetical protein
MGFDLPDADDERLQQPLEAAINDVNKGRHNRRAYIGLVGAGDPARS